MTSDVEAHRWRIKCGESIGLMRQLEPESLDAIIADPPYCSGGFTEASRQSAAISMMRGVDAGSWFLGDNLGTTGFAWLARLLGAEALRTLKPGGTLSVFADWRMVPVLAMAIESAGIRFRNLVTWDKGSPALGAGFRAQHEMILHFAKGTPAYYSKSTGNVLAFQRMNRRTREHPTQKPIELMRAIMRVVAPKDGLVLDPFCGSGSTGVAALLEGVRFIGFDHDPMWADIAKERLGEVEGTPRSRGDQVALL